MEYEEKISELTERIEYLEKKERRRVIKARIALFFRLIILGIIIFFIYKAYMFIKPYKEKIDKIDEKVTNVESFVNEKMDSLKKFNLFN